MVDADSGDARVVDGAARRPSFDLHSGKVVDVIVALSQREQVRYRKQIAHLPERGGERGRIWSKPRFGDGR
jgi:hypothetical protein